MKGLRKMQPRLRGALGQPKEGLSVTPQESAPAVLWHRTASLPGPACASSPVERSWVDMCLENGLSPEKCSLACGPGKGCRRPYQPRSGRCGWRGWGPWTGGWEVLPGGAAAELQTRLSGLHGVVLPSCDPGGQSHLTDGDMESAQRGYQHLGTQWAGPGAGGLSPKSKYDLPCQFMGPGRRGLSPQPLQGFVPQACVFRCLLQGCIVPS